MRQEDVPLTTAMPQPVCDHRRGRAEGVTPMASAAYVTFTVPTTVQIPRIVTPETDPQTADYAVAAFYGVTYSWHNHQDGDGVLATRDTIRAVVTALMEGGAVTVLYEDAKRDLTARTLYPTAVL